MFTFVQLGKIANEIIYFTYTDWPAVMFGVAIDILFPEVSDKNSKSFEVCIGLFCTDTQVAIHSLMEADKVTYEEAFAFYYS